MRPADGGASAGMSGVEIIKGTVDVTAGVPAALYTVELDEGDVIGLRVKLTGGRYNAGTLATERSLGKIDVGASRNVGAGAVISVGAGTDEVGTISGGTMSAAAVGNTVEVRVTYTATTTVSYVLRVELDRIAIAQS